LASAQQVRPHLDPEEGSHAQGAFPLGAQLNVLTIIPEMGREHIGCLLPLGLLDLVLCIPPLTNPVFQAENQFAAYNPQRRSQGLVGTNQK
jgi:hypothetical protein